MRKVVLAITLLSVSGLLGCQGEAKKPPATQAALKNWNATRAVVLIGLARDQYNNCAFDKCRITIDEAIKLSPDTAPARILSAKLFIESGQLEAAERELIQARQFDPTNAEADYLSGIVCQRWEQPERALEFYQLACERSPAELAYVLAKAEMLVDMHRRPEALAILQDKVTYFEHSGTIRDEVGLLLIQEHRYDEAVEMLRRASILASDDLTIREHLATALFDAKNYSDCADVLTDLTNHTPYDQRANLWMTLGQCQLQLSRATDAVRALQQAANLQPNNAGVWLELAQCQAQLGDLPRADSDVRRSLSLDASVSQAHLLAGFIALRQSRLQESLDRFYRAAQLDPSDTVSLCMVGLSLQKMGRSAEALQWYRQALKLKPDDEMAAHLMALLDLHE